MPRDTRPAAAPRRGGTAARGAIATAATDLFLEHGYRGTSTETVAAAAGVSKQTVYSQFGDKAALFRAVVHDVAATAGAFVDALPEAFVDVAVADDVAPALRRLARRYLATVLAPRVLAVRRLVVGEATRFPEVAAEYHRAVPGRTLAALALQLRALADRGLLLLGGPDDDADAAQAAEDFAFLVLGAALDRALFHPDAPTPSAAELAARADCAVVAFLARYPPSDHP